MSTQEQQGRRVQVPIIGSPIEVQTALETADRQGRLVMVSPPRLHGPGLVKVWAVLVEQTPARPAAARAVRVSVRPAERSAQSAVDVRVWLRRHRTALVLAASAVGALAVLGYALTVLLAWVIGNAAVLIGTGVAMLGTAAVIRRLVRPSGHSGMGWHYTKCGDR